MFAKTVTNAALVVPDGLEEMDQVIFGRALPTALHHECAVLEIVEAEGTQGLADAP